MQCLRDSAGRGRRWPLGTIQDDHEIRRQSRARAAPLPDRGAVTTLKSATRIADAQPYASVARAGAFRKCETSFLRALAIWKAMRKCSTLARLTRPFYRPHKVATWDRWAQISSRRFSFSVKAPRTITHESGLNCGPNSTALSRPGQPSWAEAWSALISASAETGIRAEPRRYQVLIDASRQFLWRYAPSRGTPVGKSSFHDKENDYRNLESSNSDGSKTCAALKA